MNHRGLLRDAVCGFALACLSSASALAQGAPNGTTGDASVYAGEFSISDGIENRTFAGFFGNVQTEGGIGFHLDLSHQWREENAGYGAVGISAELAPGIRPKLQVGSSTDNEGILPDFIVDGSVRIEAGSGSGVVLDLGGAYRDFRNGVEEGSARGEVIKYFDPFADGSYLIGQAYAAAVHADPGSHFGWELRAGLSYVRPSSWSAGLTISGGKIAYDEVTTSIGVENKFIAAHPHVSFYIADRVELFIRGELLTSDDYDLGGGLAGIKIYFP